MTYLARVVASVSILLNKPQEILNQGGTDPRKLLLTMTSKSDDLPSLLCPNNKTRMKPPVHLSTTSLSVATDNRLDAKKEGVTAESKREIFLSKIAHDDFDITTQFIGLDPSITFDDWVLKIRHTEQHLDA